MFPEPGTLRFPALLAEFASRRVLVAGDLMLDEYIWGRVSRISPEAPVPVVQVTGESYYPGGAADVARNLREFTPHVALLGTAGGDLAGDRLLALLNQSGIDTSAVLRNSTPTTVKSRIVARNQQVVRVDRESREALSRSRPRAPCAIWNVCCPASMLSLWPITARASSPNRWPISLRRRPPPRQNPGGRSPPSHAPSPGSAPPPSNPTAPKHFWLPACPVRSGPARLRGSGPARSRPPFAPPVECGEPAHHPGRAWHVVARRRCPALSHPHQRRSVFDVSGAGDTAIAILTLALASSATPAESAQLANRASGIVVGKLGTATVTLAEMQAGLPAL